MVRDEEGLFDEEELIGPYTDEINEKFINAATTYTHKSDWELRFL